MLSLNLILNIFVNTKLSQFYFIFFFLCNIIFKIFHICINFCNKNLHFIIYYQVQTYKIIVLFKVIKILNLNFVFIYFENQYIL